jgi:cytochrome bd-type quinol oxidase subunit 2
MEKTSRVLVPVLMVIASGIILAGCGPNLIERVGNFWTLGCCGVLIVILDIIALVELAGSARSTGNKVLWALLIIFFPILGCILYYFFGRS